MVHKTKESDKLVKTFKLKANISKCEIENKWIPSFEEYTNYYNGVSNWICENLITMKIGNLCQYIKNTESVYYNFITNESISNLPLYKIFTLKQTRSVDNALFCAIKEINPEKYNGNSIGLSETDYRRYGYVQCVISNYRTKIGTMKAHIKYKTLPENPSYDIVFEQTMYEMIYKGLERKENWENIISNYKERQIKNIKKINRFEKLYSFFAEHSNEIIEKSNILAIEQLSLFNGCKRKSLSAITIHSQKSKIEKNGFTSFVLNINKKMGEINLFGNRQLVSVDENGNRNDIIDICDKHGDYITFQIKNEKMFVIITANVDFDKENTKIENVVGADINIKHNMIVSSIIDNGNVLGYINIYKEMLNDADFCSSCTNKELDIYKEISKSVNFGLLECESLFSRVSAQIYKENESISKIDDKFLRREKAIENVLNKLSKHYRYEDCKIATYIDYTKIMRDSYKSYFILKEKYYEKQKEYDISMGYVDESNEKMDKRRIENPFIETETAKTILNKLNRIESRLIGCRNNITNYAFDVFKNNGFDTIALEYLDSSNFDKTKILTPLSMLKNHNFEGKSIKEIKTQNVKFKTDNYEFELDNNGKITNISFSQLGKREVMKANFFNLIIKAIHFAEIKDKFIQLSNNSHINIVLVPSAFSSQMDSKDHKLYIDENGKLVNKRMVRKQQEWHINGLNADFNAACNITYLAKNNELLENVCLKRKKIGKASYSVPYWNVKDSFKKNVSSNMIATIKKMNMVKIFNA